MMHSLDESKLTKLEAGHVSSCNTYFTNLYFHVFISLIEYVLYFNTWLLDSHHGIHQMSSSFQQFNGLLINLSQSRKGQKLFFPKAFFYLLMSYINLWDTRSRMDTNLLILHQKLQLKSSFATFSLAFINNL